VALSVAGAGLYIFVLFNIPDDVFWITDGGKKFLQVQNLGRSEHWSPEVDCPGRGLDPEMGSFLVVGRHAN
jgi:hypothetical protein